MAASASPRSSPVEESSTCRIFPRCGKSNPAWAKLQVGADLAEEMVTKAVTSAKGKGVARVAVLDSGFDTKSQTDAIDAKSFATHNGHDSAGNKDIDPDGHGTAVAGMISGMEIGITRHVELSVYRITEAHGNGSVSNGLLSAAIEKACETNDVVNVSWGSLWAELGLSPAEEELWYKKAAKQGCLVIKSAGNGGIKKKEHRDTKVPLEGPYLSVAASDEFTEDAPFSSEGSIFAPGAGVYSLLSSQHDYSEETATNKCKIGNIETGPVNGTSFASPLVAGVAAQIITILRARNLVPTSVTQKIKLVKSILFASAEWSKRSGSRHPVLSAITASLIASSVTAETSLDTKNLIAVAQKSEPLQEGCSRPAQDCTRIAGCDLKKKCVSELRFHFLVCVPPPAGVKGPGDLDRKLFDAMKQLNERELLLPVIERLPAKSPIRKEAAESLEKHWETLRNPVGIGLSDVTSALNLLQAAKRADAIDGMNVPQRLKELMLSFSPRPIFDFFHPLGTSSSQIGREREAARFLEIFKGMPDAEQMKFLREIPTTSASLSNEMDLLYYFHAHKDSLSLPVQKAFDTHMKEVAEKWFTSKLSELPGYQRLHEATADLLFSLVDKGNHRLAKSFAAPLTEETLPLHSFGVKSKSALGKKRLEAIEKLLDDPAIKSARFQELLGNSLDALMKEGSPATIRTKVRKAFLENRHAALSLYAVTGFEHQITPQQRALAEDDFFSKFIEVNLKRGIERLKEKELEPHGSSLEIENVMHAFSNNVLMTREARKKLWGGDSGKLMERFLQTAAANLVESKELKPFQGPYVIQSSFKTIESVLERQQDFKEAGLESGVKRGLTAIREDMAKSPTKYPQSLRISVARLYGLAE